VPNFSYIRQSKQ